MPESIPIFDLAEALNRAMGDADFLKMLVDELHSTIPEYIGRIKTAFESDDLDAMGNEAHQFKGAAANLGAKALAAAALKLEQIGKSGVPDGAEQALEQLYQEVEAFNQRLDSTDWSVVGTT